MHALILEPKYVHGLGQLELHWGRTCYELDLSLSFSTWDEYEFMILPNLDLVTESSKPKSMN